MEDVKIKLSALWVAAMLYGLTGAMLQLFEPGFLAQVMAGEVAGMPITPELLLVEAILLVIPPVMVFLSVTLEDKANRWANIIFGVVFIGFGLLEIVEAKSVAPIFVALVGLVFSALIIWYAWKWPKQEVKI